MQRSKASHSPATKVTSKPSPNSSTSYPPSKKFRSAGQSAGSTSSSSNTTTISLSKKMLGETRISPSNPPHPDPFTLQYHGKTTVQATTPSLDDIDRSSVSDNDSVLSPLGHDKVKPAPGKKTRGRVKIEMQYIQNKLRRYTTFSKRKSGMMKKAYELSTLTGTQVMLLVASETGHVYTFATPKLQPMITSDAGKALIQTCLHTPDPPQALSEYDMRMSASGYEETELSYTINDDDAFKTGLETPPTHMVPNSHMHQPPSGPVVAIPQGMMPFAMQEQQQINNMIQPQQQTPYQPLSSVSQQQPSMTHTNSPPPTYSPTHPPSPPRNYPGSPPYSQSSHISHQQPMMMEDITASPMRKSPPEGAHYLSHHHHYERSPSHSPMGHFQSVRTTHSPPQQQSMYTPHPGDSPATSGLVNPSQMGHM